MLAHILSDPRVKEVAISERGLRIVRQTSQGKRGEYLLLRQSVFENATVPGDQFAAGLEDLQTLRQIASTYRRSQAA
jgi:hypothetical protein